MASPILQYFTYPHLPAHLPAYSRPFGELAAQIDAAYPDGPEKSAGLRTLLESKDCIVRVALTPAPVHALGTGPPLDGRLE